MAQQTAVEWLFNQLPDHLRLTENGFEMLQQAKEMDKQQKQECWNVAHQAGRFEGKGIAEENWQTFEDYYNETYKQ